jgi:hypothetical protein
MFADEVKSPVNSSKAEAYILVSCPVLRVGVDIIEEIRK